MDPRLEIPPQYYIEDGFDRGGRMRIYRLMEILRKLHGQQ